MTEHARERKPEVDEPSSEGQQQSREDYESPTVDDIPVDRPAVTEPGAVLLTGGTPD